jgi:hypothetical protein
MAPPSIARNKMIEPHTNSNHHMAQCGLIIQRENVRRFAALLRISENFEKRRRSIHYTYNTEQSSDNLSYSVYPTSRVYCPFKTLSHVKKISLINARRKKL